MAITFSGLGGARPTASAQTLIGQALTSPSGVTVSSTPTVRSSTDIIPPGQPRTAGFRYLHVTFPVSVTDSPVTNLTFLGAALTGNPGASAVLTLDKYPGGNAAPYTSSELAALAAAIDPTSPVTQDVFAQTPALVAGEEDALQLYNESDVSGLTLPGGQTGSILPYGFVSHAGTSRTIPVGTDTGTVTLAIKVPLQAQAKDDPYTVTLTFVPVQDSVTSITESPEAQLPSNQAAFQAAVDRLGTPVIKTLPGSTRAGGALFCSVRTAGAVGAPTGTLAGGIAPVDLAIGATVRIPANATTCLNGGGSGADYVIFPFNTSTTASRPLTVTTTNTVAPVGSQSIGVPTLSDQASELTPLSTEPQVLATTLSSATTLSQASSVQPQVLPPGTPTVGDQVVINAASGCNAAPDLRTGTVRVVGPNVVLISDNANPAGGPQVIGSPGTPGYQDVVNSFTNQIWPAVTGSFGLPEDADNNNRIVLFFTSAVNARFAQGTLPGPNTGLQGFSDARDEFPITTCTSSNVGEIIYLLAADLTGSINNNTVNVANTIQYGTQVTARELGRIINNSRRVRTTGAPLEEAWLDQGLADIAAELSFYRASGVTPGGADASKPGLTPRLNIALTDVNGVAAGTAASVRTAAFNTFANIDFTLYRPFLTNPNQTGPYWTTNTLAARGATWNFLRYAADRYVTTTGNTEANFWTALINSNTTGLANLQNVIGTNPITWMNDWAVATYADDAVAGIAPIFNSPSWNYRSLLIALGGFPPNAGANRSARTLVSGTPYTRTYEKTSTNYLLARVGANQQGGITVSSPNPSDFTVTVLRTQ
ncbi:hypothetical protein K7W42_15295 [Deinococcus sp. HMF7604]|uniref:hypothetical protein n=1 Tax=Deinococcus betulae TaxID=2873312 RepID=UPI001CC94C06|nr:hypothetical protein [Deinococcus betulae]MBZ9752220.1 hypothetical protein [Deinococcus betulae]